MTKRKNILNFNDLYDKLAITEQKSEEEMSVYEFMELIDLRCGKKADKELTLDQLYLQAKRKDNENRNLH
jgi:hypothetical protein